MFLILILKLKVNKIWIQPIPNMVLAIHSWLDEAKYESYWKDDLQHGKGIKVKADGLSYNWEFKMNKKHGHVVQ